MHVSGGGGGARTAEAEINQISGLQHSRGQLLNIYSDLTVLVSIKGVRIFENNREAEDILAKEGIFHTQKNTFVLLHLYIIITIFFFAIFPFYCNAKISKHHNIVFPLATLEHDIISSVPDANMLHVGSSARSYL